MLCWQCKPTDMEPQKPYLERCVKKKSATATTPSGTLNRGTQISVRNAGTYSSASIGIALDGSIWATLYVCLIKISVLKQMITTEQDLNRSTKIKEEGNIKLKTTQ